MERWRKPATIAAVEEDPSRIYHDGNVYRRQVDITFDLETITRFRLGYVCWRCMEPQEIAMPNSCLLCGYAMKDFQTADMAREIDGVKQIGPSTSVDDEIAMMRERKQRERLWTPPNAA